MLNFKTESLYHKSESPWSFYGQFAYSNGRVDSVRYNLSYDIELNGSPYYYFMKKAGDWNLQYYYFDAAASRVINRKLALAFNIKYKGKQFFRLIDTRNSQTKLETELKLGATYTVNKGNSISVTAQYEYDKMEPSLSNKFQHSSASEKLLYNIYLNAGMGTYFKAVTYICVTTYLVPGVSVQWISNPSSNHMNSLSYSCRSGKEEWKNKAIYSAEKENIYSKYEFQDHTVSFATKRGLTKSTFDGLFDAQILQGKGFKFNDTSKKYTQNYNFTNINAEFQTLVTRKESLFDQMSLGVKLDFTKKRDKSYACSMEYVNALFNVGIRAHMNIKDKYLYVSLHPGYCHNFSKEYDEGIAGDNIYTNWIGNPVYEFVSTNWYCMDAKIGLRSVIDKFPVDFQLNYFLKKTTGGQDVLGDKTADHFTRMGCKFKIYF
ncbi:hypothetical protein EYV94_23640 [Puteibacter caeruleilacunae]|nr:hypothetical protein EYV94_23640 [Puteibacter caeruleilacunae]